MGNTWEKGVPKPLTNKPCRYLLEAESRWMKEQEPQLRGRDTLLYFFLFHFVDSLIGKIWGEVSDNSNYKS